MFNKYKGISFEDQIKQCGWNGVKLKSTGRGLIRSDCDEKFEVLENRIYKSKLNYYNAYDENEVVDEFYGFHIEEII
ncbi:hypothetical protein [Metabacillus fastidiosus]|uniref:hypothetical protein n=1 Tax=Metabacillus fastidiosus TaxID=1458 RepID=UPI003D2BD57A